MAALRKFTIPIDELAKALPCGPLAMVPERRLRQRRRLLRSCRVPIAEDAVPAALAIIEAHP